MNIRGQSRGLLELLRTSQERPSSLRMFFAELLASMEGATSLCVFQDQRDWNSVLDMQIHWGGGERRSRETPGKLWLIKSDTLLCCGAALDFNAPCVCRMWSSDQNDAQHLCLRKEVMMPGGRLTLSRPRLSRDFEARDAERIRSLLPHLQRALSLRPPVLEMRMGLPEASEILERLPVGVILVNRGNKVVRVNQNAQAILERGEGLVLKQDGICAQIPAECNSLRILISQASQKRFSRDYPHGARLSLSRPGAKRLLHLTVTAVAGFKDVPGETRPGAAILIDPDYEMESSGQDLVRKYGLTLTEARLALLIAHGLSPKEIAGEMDITIATVRTHLRNIYAKTRTRRQTELIRMILHSRARSSSDTCSHPSD